MQFCGECGAQVEDGALFCDECGAKIEPQESTNPTSSAKNTNPDNVSIKPKKKSSPLPILFICLIVAGIGAYFILGNKTPDATSSKKSSAENTSNHMNTTADDLDVSLSDNTLTQESEISQPDTPEGTPSSTTDETPSTNPDSADSHSDSLHEATPSPAYDYYGLWVGDKGSYIEISPYCDEASGYKYYDNLAELIIYTKDEMGWYEEHVTYLLPHETLEAFISTGCTADMLDSFNKGVYIYFTITDGSIYAQNVTENCWPYGESFTQAGFMEPAGSETSSYKDEIYLEINTQYSDDTYTYLYVSEFENLSARWIIRFDGKDALGDMNYEYYYLTCEKEFYPDMYLKGFPLCVVDPNQIEVISYDEYWNINW